MAPISSQLEAILLLFGKPARVTKIAALLNVGKDAAQSAVENLRDEYKREKRGFRIATNGETVELVTAPEHALLAQKVAHYQKKEMTRAKIETLAILAYRGPLAKEELESIRGVNCSLILKNLSIDELIDEVNQGDTLLYHVSTRFLAGLGLTGVHELPDYEQLQVKKD